MKIVADEEIPLVNYYFGGLGDIIVKPGRAITRNDLLDAEVLLIRSVTKVNEALLHHTPIKYVGSATTGADHLDTVWLNQANIKWSTAKNGNATAVVEYVFSVIAALQKKHFLLQPQCRAGVIGVGAIGERVANKLSALGFSVLLCDPFRNVREKDFQGVLLEEFFDLDFITLHTPLTYDGSYPTYHLLGKDFFQRQKKGCILLNTGRGSVIDFADLKKYGRELIWCLDVWENEPTIDLEVLQQAFIATPHIAGYTRQSKYRGTQMIYHAAIQQSIIPALDLPSLDFPRSVLSFAGNSAHWQDVLLKIYDPLVTTSLMKQAIRKNSHSFDILRKSFSERNELRFVELKDVFINQYDSDVLNILRS